MNTRTIAAIALVAGLVVETQGFAQVAISTGTSASIATVAATTSDPEQAARKTWRSVMANIPVQGKGCFHVQDFPGMGPPDFLGMGPPDFLGMDPPDFLGMGPPAGAAFRARRRTLLRTAAASGAERRCQEAIHFRG
jgi:hypothetical protein